MRAPRRSREAVAGAQRAVARRDRGHGRASAARTCGDRNRATERRCHPATTTHRRPRQGPWPRCMRSWPAPRSTSRAQISRAGGAPYTSAAIVQTLQSQADPLSAVLTAHAGIKAALTRGAAPRAPFHWRRAERAARGGAVQIVEGAGRQRGAKPEGSGTSSSGPGRARVAADAPGLSTPCAPPPDRTGRSRPSTPSPGTPRYPSWSSRREARR